MAGSVRYKLDGDQIQANRLKIQSGAFNELRPKIHREKHRNSYRAAMRSKALVISFRPVLMPPTTSERLFPIKLMTLKESSAGTAYFPSS